MAHGEGGATVVEADGGTLLQPEANTAAAAATSHVSVGSSVRFISQGVPIKKPPEGGF
jgi:hypothetical protein